MTAGILLRGLDGSNPLAFLAALGTLRTLTLALPSETVRMGWERAEGAWRPRLFCPLPNIDVATSRIAESLVKEPRNHPVMVWQEWMSKDPRRVQEAFAKVAGVFSPESLYMSAVGSDAAPPSEDDGIADNPFRASRTDYFIKNLAAIISRCTRDHLWRTLARPWDYGDAMENQSLRLDATDDRRHAYQWTAPTLDESRKRNGTMLGANRLAIEAYVFFQSCMSGGFLSTVGFGKKLRGSRSLRWPIWGVPIGTDVTASLLSCSALWDDSANADLRSRLHAMGVREVFQARRIKVGDSNPRTNFTPAAPVVAAGLV